MLNLCYTKTNYDAASGQRCRDLASGATWRYYTINATKVGHLTLNSTGALAEIWIASDGTPSVNIGSEHCEVSIVGGESGMTCKMVSYRYRQTKRVTSSLSFEMVVDTAGLGFSPASKTIKYSGNGSTGITGALPLPIATSLPRRPVRLCVPLENLFPEPDPARN